jgi:transposase
MSEAERALRQENDHLRKMVEELDEELKKSRRREEQLLHEMAKLARRLFGRKSEKLDTNQLALVFEEMESLGLCVPAAEEEDFEEKQPARRPRRRARRDLPGDLPRERIDYHPSDEEMTCGCCGARKMHIGVDVSEQLEYIPAVLKVIEHAVHAYACRFCEGNVSKGTKPPQPISKGLPGPGLLAHVLVCKYADHLPLYRQEKIWERHGVHLSRKTLCDWVRATADPLSRIVDYLTLNVLRSDPVHTDDTVIPVLNPGHGKALKGRLWVYVGGNDIVFDYTPTRERDGPAKFLRDFSGYLQADAYAGYDAIYAGGRVLEVACWMHTRRYFYEAYQVEAKGPVPALAFIKQLFALEEQAKSMSAEERCRHRKEHAVPVLDSFKAWLDKTAYGVLPKSPLATAIGYTLRQWDALVRYTESGILSIDNGEAERALRLIAIGRKNWLFAGSDDGGRRAAIVFSLIATCKYNGIDPYAYLTDVLRRLPTCPDDSISELAPRAWAAARTKS